MTPAARLSAAIEILDHILDGVAAEKALTNWARGSRFAGSKDRAAVRDHVFSSLRCKRSFAVLGGAKTGRGIILGLLRSQAIAPADMFTGIAHAPQLMSEDESSHSASPTGNDALDCPDWIAPQLQASLGDDFAAICHAQQSRAPLFLRVNPLKTTIEQVAAALADENIATQPHALSPTALQVTENPRRVHLSAPYLDGRIELQDAASQAVVDSLPILPDTRVLDYCAGGGGKVLAMAARVDAQYFAYDLNFDRMKDLSERADRAGVVVRQLESDDLPDAAPFDLVLCDVPCSGSGAWRRVPAAKWQIDQERLDELCQIQAGILADAAKLVSDGGVLAYSTCSLLDVENSTQISEFLAANPDWECTQQRQFTPLDGADGFFCTHLTRK